MDRLEINKKKFCRLCLSETVISHSLLNDDNTVFLEALTAIKIDEDEPFPTIACVKCCFNLKFAFQIQQNILEADRKLHMLEEINMDELDIKTRIVDNAVEVEEKIQSVEECILDHDYEGRSSTEPSTPLSRNSPKSTVSELETEDLKIAVQYETVKTELKSDEDNSVENVFVTETETEEPVLFSNFLAEANTNDSEKVPCKICGQEFLDKDMLDHVQFHYFSTIKCDECNMNCANIHTYREHLAQAHKDYPANKSWTCKICNGSFFYKPLYIIHFKSAHHTKIDKEEKPGIYHCYHCKKTFSNESRRTAHTATHNKKQCDICGVYITPSNFPAHRKSHLENEVECPICLGKYKNTISLKGHIHYTHSTRNYICEFCDKSFKKSYALLLHVKREHTGERPHICDICGKSFLTFYNLNKHKKMTHQKLRPFECEQCQRKFSSKFALRTHERQHTQDMPFTCNICGQSFRQKVSLKGHRKTVHNIEEPLTCACEVCGKWFSSKFAVMSHMRLH
ncbi:uncharacterized protein [Diabrotica undecimpunctata]|uniref:uncharacterized protein n=1 Tax=Diabrotica undecimpunctata TaxID=50387 RepID=UPI003B6358CB